MSLTKTIAAICGALVLFVVFSGCAQNDEAPEIGETKTSDQAERPERKGAMEPDLDR